ncbi:methyltransferase domain-containing protein [Piscinibacter sakaiensis]|uniref:Methyltransferase type 11 domain-containing protein n=1 Tax=Piscinibacter sakaiensis TaxID=1547922 RepID=A0A0K8NXT3_PISS1|nr:methyltransferase domain-containing protein [Piscinibacter sakaiensis]GAP35178.1 hypothetical protein ISF6_0749 [Piscinibacter sakaiensis]
MPIDPQDVIRRWTLEELNGAAEEYFATLTDPGFQLAKPFSGVRDAPPILHNLGMLLEGLQLGAGMTVLELGAGTCWLSRLLTQMQCAAIACDVSPTALALGRRLFDEQPPVGRDLVPPRFLLFDGRRLELPDASVDRVICFDAFHHVPNRAEVLKELARVLRPGGLAGFSEPGPQHSQSPQSQLEMANYKVLENDIDLDRVFAEARAAGFTDARFSPRLELSLPVSAYRELLEGRPGPALQQQLLLNASQLQVNKTVFYLLKGEAVPDSRSVDGLAAEMRPARSAIPARPGERIDIACTVRNSGTALWLAATPNHHGEVLLGGHLYADDGRLVTLDALVRARIPADLPPGAEATLTVWFHAPAAPGRYRLALDMVAEFVCWFGEIGTVRPMLDIDVAA